MAKMNFSEKAFLRYSCLSCLLSMQFCPGNTIIMIVNERKRDETHPCIGYTSHDSNM